jgi:hypothetical protein
MRAAAAGAALALTILVGVAMARDPERLQAERIFAAIDRLIEHRAAEPAEFERLVHTRIAPVPELSTPFFTVYRGDFEPPSPFRQIEIRQPLVPPRERGVIILEIGEGVCVGPQAVRARYGPEPALAPPSARQPAGSPIYYVYDRPWGKLSLALSRGTPECLERAVIDWHG